VSKKAKTLLSWSGGKNSAVALFELKSPDYKITSLLTTLETPELKHSGSGIHQSLIQKQAASLEIPSIFTPESALSDVLKPLQRKGLNGISYSYAYREELKVERENYLRSHDLDAYFPIWKWDSREVLRVFFSLGYKAIVCSVNLAKLPLPFVGREFDQDFIDDLPSGIEPLGEQGEYHTFVYDGPFFQRRVEFQKSKVYEKNGYGFQALD